MGNLKIILASKSPRRSQILAEMGYEFEIMPSQYEEELPAGKFNPVMIQELAFNKANEVAQRVDRNSLILGADTMVVDDDLVLGKPSSYDDAFFMLKNLSDKKHYVVTGVAGINNSTGRIVKDFVITYVTFNELTDDMINSYIERYRPYDKAGAYGIQELPSGFVKSLQGEFDNVVGFPSKRVREIIEELS